MTNIECHQCPFSTVDHSYEEPNPSDLGEGRYKCELLGKTVWGENPECESKHWKNKMKQEIEQCHVNII